MDREQGEDVCEPCVLGDGVASPRVYVRIPSPCLQPVSSFSLFFLIFSPPYAFYPSFASFRDDPSSRSFFEILLRDGGERRRKEDVLF